MTHIVQTSGHYQCPEFSTITEARTHLRALVQESLEKAKRKAKTATKHKLAEDSYCITLGRDRRSTLWATHYIVSGVNISRHA